MLKIAINGFGRIGRAAFKIAFERENLDIVAINDLADVRQLSYLLNYDSAYGLYKPLVAAEVGGTVLTAEEVTYPEEYFGDVDVKADKYLLVNGRRIRVFQEKDPLSLPWKDYGVDVVLECTGFFTEFAKAKDHITAGAKKVVISAPGKGKGKTVVLGTPSTKEKISDSVVANASCTTNCIAPVAHIINEKFIIKQSWMTTVHSYTADQNSVDGPHRDDLRRGRSAAANIVPTTSGAAKAAALAVPDLKDKFDGCAIRVPTLTVSLAIITSIVEKSATVESVNQALEKAANTTHKGIISCTAAPVVSSDFKGDEHSAIIDLDLTNVMGTDFVTVFAWYDNEWGYATRLVDMAEFIGE